MDFTLNDIEIRVLGSLMEKEMTTPEYYPLSLNALINACNQKSSREPVVNYDETTVARALESLREKRFVYVASGSRVDKYGNNFTKANNLIREEAAILCLLMLRGPQTSGELRSRSDRLHSFENIDEVEKTIADLIELKFVLTLPKQPGRKEPRHAHLLSGEPDPSALAPLERPEAAILEVRAENDRLSRLESDIASLRSDLAELKDAFLDFKKQFE